MTTEITVTEKQLAVFDIKSAVFAEIKSYENLDIVNSETEKDVRAARVAVRDVRYKIQKRQKELNSDLNSKKKEYKEAAETLIERLKPTEDNLDTKIKAIEAERKIKKAAKDKAEADRLAVIQNQIENLKDLCVVALEYNMESRSIELQIELIEHCEIDDSFQEMKPQAEMIKIGGIAAAKQALKARQDWEAQQSENERIRLENEAKAKELADAQAKIEAEQEKARQEAARVAKEAADKQAKADADVKAKREAEEAKLAAERKKIEDEKAEIQAEKDRMAAEAEKIRMDERIKWCESVGDVWMLADIEDAEAFQAAFNAGLERSKEIDESIRIEQLAAKEKRAALVEADKKALVEIGLKINELVSSVTIPAFQTQEASRITGDLFNGLHRVLNELELSLTELV